MKEYEKPTPEQIENLRKLFSTFLGPYALIIPDEDVILIRDIQQRRIDELEKSLESN